MTTNLDLDAIRKRAAHVIAGPWTVGEPKCVDGVDAWEIPIHLPRLDDGTPDERSEFAVVRYQTAGFHYPHADAYADAEFIAHAREDIPTLLAEIDQLRTMRDYDRRSRFEYEERVSEQVENLRDEIERLKKAQEQDAILIASMRAAIDEADAEGGE